MLLTIGLCSVCERERHFHYLPYELTSHSERALYWFEAAKIPHHSLGHSESKQNAATADM